MLNTYVLKFILHILIQIIEKTLLCILSVNSNNKILCLF